jgi:hypothetical protein
MSVLDPKDGKRWTINGRTPEKSYEILIMHESAALGFGVCSDSARFAAEECANGFRAGTRERRQKV